MQDDDADDAKTKAKHHEAICHEVMCHEVTCHEASWRRRWASGRADDTSDAARRRDLAARCLARLASATVRAAVARVSATALAVARALVVATPCRLFDDVALATAIDDALDFVRVTTTSHWPSSHHQPIIVLANDLRLVLFVKNDTTNYYELT
jgi:hypothetical protein